ncbi:uncharacterized protein LOC143851291 [Tasmannia lanceolata]|uniref:uncharacterized protein LOC143851291 n=1 Tax=Tasmannia lanceolata TaxID=3420 RepID=UPI004064431E
MKTGVSGVGRVEVTAPSLVGAEASMAKEQTIPRPWILDAVPLLVVVLIAVHVFALVYWIYRLATEKQPQRRKAH